jgi:hypothetical protein
METEIDLLTPRILILQKETFLEEIDLPIPRMDDFFEEISELLGLQWRHYIETEYFTWDKLELSVNARGFLSSLFEDGKISENNWDFLELIIAKNCKAFQSKNCKNSLDS